MLKIFKYTSSLIFCMLMVYSVQAQKIKVQQKTVSDSIPVPFFNGIIVEGDVASIVGSALSKGVTYSYEGAVKIDLKHKFYPTFEFGYAGADKLTVDNVGFNTNGVFWRGGIDINMLKHKKAANAINSMLLLGVRLGVSNFNYSISNVNITDEYWGGPVQAMNYNNLSTTKVWLELTAGIRVEVLKNIYMGWTIRNKNLLTSTADGAVTPWYIPGFGTNKSSNLGLNYTIGYKFQLPSKKKNTAKPPTGEVITAKKK
ncbi:hypothetical protein Palpr_0213 [Paludibacter propionicigenes WB4]|uniref:Outer membrane protein beta-barrel domain-containing protein n=1 Tax=Paludibacter propionicigenes (strain DSM 17365 / JCM 13257 / WB4) TaxID=694427 RepID=E4T0Z4_PALPW|nr:DUF6048 family protein [Paludibacter propionicigenes]ADQ78375.1 hypothetical protein Palpr_0213 [Paludibacter propionicigenes WB4]